MIISISRRCDIPRFRFDWFMERLDAGFAEAANPFNAAQVRRAPLRPDPADPAAGAEVLVFWTRDPRPLLARAEELERRGCRFYVMVTVTGYPGLLEPQVPEAETVCRAMKELGKKIGPRRVIWRYDPVFLSTLTDTAFHRENFTALARSLKGAVRRVIVSLYDPYRGAERRVAALEKSGALRPLPCTGGEGRPLPRTRELLGDLAEAARRADMETQSCAEAEDLAPLGITRGACIDGERIRELWGVAAGARDKNQRPHCRCAPAVDIGSYGPCPAGCVYCYARR
ncbi:MAG: DUF1848 domain-containing protein [Treponema sp.]|jgi:hypothetical protein|nr:DUF1848 domain-containing protein [Treponema sp.]